MRLKRSLLFACILYNRLRAKKMEEYREKHFSMTRNDLRTQALVERHSNPEFALIYAQVAQEVADRVFKAFRRYFSGNARFPKPKHPTKYLSLTYPQRGFKLEPQGLLISQAGHIRVFLHRPIKGRIKRLTIKREAGKWYAIITIENKNAPRKPLREIEETRVRGADLGLDRFAVLDNNMSTEYPEYLRHWETKISGIQKHLSRKKKGSKRWKLLGFSLAKLHAHVKRQREDWQNKFLSEVFKNNDILVLEKLNIKKMLRNHSLAKSISDAGWGKFAKKANFKALMLGKWFIAVDPWGTTQFCYNCLTWVPKKLSERRHKCTSCGVELSRDLNSARLIKWLGIRSCPPSDGGSSLAEPRPLPSLRGTASQGCEAGSH